MARSGRPIRFLSGAAIHPEQGGAQRRPVALADDDGRSRRCDADAVDLRARRDRPSARGSPCRAPPTSRAATARPSPDADGASRSAPRARPASRARSRSNTPTRTPPVPKSRPRSRAIDQGRNMTLEKCSLRPRIVSNIRGRSRKREIMRDHEFPFQACRRRARRGSRSIPCPGTAALKEFQAPCSDTSWRRKCWKVLFSRGTSPTGIPMKTT